MHLLRAWVVDGLSRLCARDVRPARRRRREADVNVLEGNAVVRELQLEDDLRAVGRGGGPAAEGHGQEGVVRALELPFQKWCRCICTEGTRRFSHFEDVVGVGSLVQVGMDLVLELLILRGELEADKICFGYVQDCDLELASAHGITTEATLHLEIGSDPFLNLNLDRVQKRVHSRRCRRLGGLLFCILCSCWLSHLQACKHVTGLLLGKDHSLPWRTWLDRRGPVV
mmetsp:Transcript_75144/g.220238  ORF Transcript_75144/g.220238 Transcript_75144/m.220238 type:complete len:227 (-) Transcript_75144:755-1435(-)